MLKKHAEFLKSLLIISDLIFISIAWYSAYMLRFYSGLMPVTKGIPPFTPYLIMLPVTIIIWTFVLNAFDLYRPRRISTRLSEIWDITKACSLAVLLVITLSFFTRQYQYSRGVLILFWIISIVFIAVNRVLFREMLRVIRRKGYNQRHVLILGAEQLGRRLAGILKDRSELGLKVRGILTGNPSEVGKDLSGHKVLGTYDKLPEIMSANYVDQIFIALPYHDYPFIEKILPFLQNQTADVRIVPDLVRFITVRGEAEYFEGIPIITIQSSPLYGWNRVMKRAMDIVFSIIILGVSLPLIMLIAAVVKLSSPGPVLYQQNRMGYDGRVFKMLKFRTMHVDAEKETGAVWAKPYDNRRTIVGAFLRRTSLDELPQFWNVLKGEMSIVGPRPERPEFIEIFKQSIPKYMLRHKVKAGITGLAQVNGWRGNTSVEERIKCDLEYIEKWSIWLDLKIMWLTLWKGFINKNAY